MPGRTLQCGIYIGELTSVLGLAHSISVSKTDFLVSQN